MKDIKIKRPQQKRSEAKFLSILAAFPRVVDQYGYRKASTEKIALEANVGIGTVYDYFSNKEAVLIAYLDLELGMALEAVESLSTESGMSVRETLLQFVTVGVDFAYQQREMIKLLFTHLGDRLDLIDLEQSRKKLHRIAVDFAVNKDLEIINKNPALMIYSLTNLVIGFQFRIVAMPDHRIAKEAMINELVEMIIRYISPVHQPYA